MPEFITTNLNPDPETYEFFLGRYVDQNEEKYIAYTGEGGLITFGKPGTGKSECHAKTNLLNWGGSALVLDIKGDLYEDTHGWREQLGPVFRFNPFDPSTNRYNPMEYVGNSVCDAWSDGKFLAEMLIPSSDDSGEQKFWNNLAREILGAAIAYVAVEYQGNPNARTFESVLDIVSGRDWESFIAEETGSLLTFAKTHNFAPAERTVANLQDLNRGKDNKTLSSCRLSAYAALNAWNDTNLCNATQISDWNPEDLHGENPVTVYIGASSAQQFSSQSNFFRVIIGQHINMLMMPQFLGTKSLVMLLLDEFPVLGYMRPIEEAITLGRGYGLRPWLMAQYLQQITKAYESDTIVQTCAVRCYLNPDFETAKNLAEEIGYENNIRDGNRALRFEPQQLMGAEYKDKIFVFGPFEADPKWRVFNKLYAKNRENDPRHPLNGRYNLGN